MKSVNSRQPKVHSLLKKDVARENALVTTLLEVALTAAKPMLNAGIVARKITYKQTAS